MMGYRTCPKCLGKDWGIIAVSGGKTIILKIWHPGVYSDIEKAFCLKCQYKFNPNDYDRNGNVKETSVKYIEELGE